MEIHLRGETIKAVEETKTSPAGYRVTATFGVFENIDQCKRFLSQLEDLAMQMSGQTKLEATAE